MKQLFTLALFALTSATVFGQLYVQPTTNSASYVYVEGTFVYVKEGVDLRTNVSAGVPTSERQIPSIALRQGAQFLQGNSTVKNSGDGFLSVFQEGTADAFNYNFWASPVGLSSATAGDNGDFQLRDDELNTNLFIPTNDILTSSTPNILGPNEGYNSTFGGGPSGGGYNIASYWLFSKDHGDDYGSWDEVWDINSVSAGYGFTMKGVDADDANNGGEGSANNTTTAPNTIQQRQRYDFKGRPNTGAITIPVFVNDEILIGNPYPSAFDLSYFLIANSGSGSVNYTNMDGSTVSINRQNILTGTAHFWEYDPTVHSHYLTEYQGGYGTYNTMGIDFDPIYMPATFASYYEDGTENTTGLGNGDATLNRRFSPVGQGFFVYSSTTLPASTTMIIDNRYRIYVPEGSNSDFRTSSDVPVPGIGVDISYADVNNMAKVSQLRLNVKINDTYTRQLGIAFMDDATLNIDAGKDGRNVTMIGTDVFLVIDGEDNFVLNTHSYDRENMLPLTFKVGSQSLFKINLGSQIDFPGDEVYLYDDERQEFHDILNGEVRYMLDEGVYENRFFITFKNRNDEEETEDEETDDGTLSLEDSVLESFYIFQNNPSGQLEIQNPKNVVLNTVSLYDIAGKQIFNRTNLGSEQTYTFPTGNLSDAIYIVRIVTQEGLTKARKISVFNK